MLPAGSTGLVLDLYHLDSAYVAWRAGLDARATFDLYTRTHPFGGAYMVAAGLEPALELVASFGYGDDDIAYLRGIKPYDEGFLGELRGFRYTGDVEAMPEGTICFADEPLVRTTAPFRQALLLESGLMRAINVSTLVATKAARVVDAAAGRPVAEFALRRAHAAFLATRAAHIGGCASTSFVAAARRFGIPPTGTIPHALVQAFPSEEDAFKAVAEALPAFTLLLDTYDVQRAVHTAAQVARDAEQKWGHRLQAVRLDSGDMAADARFCRRVLDDAGLTDVRIFASGDLDEYKIEDLVRSGAPIDGFGVGSTIGVGLGSIEHRAPGGFLTCAYKLVWYEGGGLAEHEHAVIKWAREKSTWPGRKQVDRVGAFEGDVIRLEDEPPAGTPLLEPVMRDGARIGEPASPAEARARARAGLEALPRHHRALLDPVPYPVTKSEALQRLRDDALRRRGLG